MTERSNTTDPVRDDLLEQLRGWREVDGMSDDARRKLWLMQKAANEIKRLCAALSSVASVEKQIRLMAYTNAGDPKLMDDMKMYAIWAGTLQAALAVTGDAP